jgi:putative transposase
MSRPAYQWRTLSSAEREEVLADRQLKRHPWHAPPHRPSHGVQRYHLTAACYEHTHHIGRHPERIDSFSTRLLEVLRNSCDTVFAWVVLPNHYHALLESEDVITLIKRLGRLHGKTSFEWNAEEGARGRKVFCGAVEREIRSERHFWSTMNYVLNNPVRHGYVRKWTDWPWSNATEYLDSIGLEKAKEIWQNYPVRDYGAGWDDPEL